MSERILEVKNLCKYFYSGKNNAPMKAVDDVSFYVNKGETLGLIAVMSIVPCLLMIATYFIYRKKYIIDEDEYERIVDELAMRKSLETLD